MQHVIGLICAIILVLVAVRSYWDSLWFTWRKTLTVGKDVSIRCDMHEVGSIWLRATITAVYPKHFDVKYDEKLIREVKRTYREESLWIVTSPGYDRVNPIYGKIEEQSCFKMVDCFFFKLYLKRKDAA
jgi:hypothetical protein